MKRSLAYKLLIFTCASSCWMNANANMQMGDELVTITDPFPEITNVACNALSRTYFYKVTNESENDEWIAIDDFDIEILPGDSFPDNDLIVQIDQSQIPPALTSDACMSDTFYAANDSCWIAVTVTPGIIECPDQHPLLQDGKIRRELFINVDAGSQTEVESLINFDVTVLGTAQEYALFADCLIIDSDGWGPMLKQPEDCFPVGSSDDANILEIVQVSQDVGYADDIFDPDDLLMHDDAQLIDGFYTEIAPMASVLNQNFAAAADAQAAYQTLKAAAYDDGSVCVGPQLDPRGDKEIGPGIYCLTDNVDNDYFLVDGRLTFRGNKDALFVFVMPSLIDGDALVDEEILLEVETGASYRLTTSAGIVNPDNIIWVGADVIEFDSGVSIPGTFLTKGLIFADSSMTLDFPDFPGSDPVGPAIITGRLIGLASCDDFPTEDQNAQCNSVESFIFLDSNTIVDGWFHL